MLSFKKDTEITINQLLEDERYTWITRSRLFQELIEDIDQKDENEKNQKDEKDTDQKDENDTDQKDELFIAPICNIKNPNILDLFITIRFWLFDYIPVEVFDVLSNTKKTIQILREIAKENPRFADEFFVFLYSHTVDQLGRNASEKGHISILRWIVAKGNQLKKEWQINSALNGHVEVLFYFLELGKPITNEALNKYIEYGDIKIIKQLSEKGVNFNCDQADKALIYKNKEILIFLFVEKGIKPSQSFFNKFVSNIENNKNSMEIFDFLYQYGNYLVKVDDAIKDRKMYFLNHLKDNGYKFHQSNYTIAIENGNLEIVKLLFESGTSLYDGLFNRAYFCKNLNIMKWLYEHDCLWTNAAHAVYCDDMEIIRWLHSVNFEFTKNEFINAIRSGNMEFIEFMYKLVPLSDYLIDEAIETNNLNILKWLIERNCPVEEDILYYIAFNNGNLDIVQYLYDNNFEISDGVINEQIMEGNMKNVNFLHELGIKFVEKHAQLAAEAGNFEMLEFIYSIL